MKNLIVYNLDYLNFFVVPTGSDNQGWTVHIHRFVGKGKDVSIAF